LREAEVDLNFVPPEREREGKQKFIFKPEYKYAVYGMP
jgi:hypothetical protein